MNDWQQIHYHLPLIPARCRRILRLSLHKRVQNGGMPQPCQPVFATDKSVYLVNCN